MGMCVCVLAVFIPYIGSWLVRARLLSVVVDKEIYKYVVFTKYTRWLPFCWEMTAQQNDGEDDGDDGDENKGTPRRKIDI